MTKLKDVKFGDLIPVMKILGTKTVELVGFGPGCAANASYLQDSEDHTMLYWSCVYSNWTANAADYAEYAGEAGYACGAGYTEEAGYACNAGLATESLTTSGIYCACGTIDCTGIIYPAWALLSDLPCGAMVAYYTE